MARTFFSALFFVGAVTFFGLTGCDKPTHDNIDKWMTSKKGLGKLKETFTAKSLDPDLSAHAAENLLRRSEEDLMRKAFESMNPARREQVVAKLAVRLWNMARIPSGMAQPTSTQETAKDTLFDLRAWADTPTREAIDGYLTDWLTGGYYERRAIAGRHPGVQVIRVLGAKAGERLIAEANRMIAAPDDGGRRLRIGDQLLLGLAAAGSPQTVEKVLDIFAMDRGDPTLPDRAMGALFRAYLDPQGLFDLVDPKSLVPTLQRLADIAKDDRQSAQITNDAVQLIRAAGLPDCIAPLMSMVGHPHRDPRFRWVAVNNALRCGGAKVLADVVKALPTSGHYDADVLGGATWQSFAAMGDRDGFINAARALLQSPSWVVRWIGIEALGALQSKADAGAVTKLAGDRTKLVGYWGDQADNVKPDPTLGQRAKEVALLLK